MKRLLLAVVFCLVPCLLPAVSRGAVDPAGLKPYRLEIDIAAPPEFLYPYLIEEEKISRWQQDSSVDVTFPTGREPRIGKQIRVAVRAPSDPWILMEIVKLDPGREIRTEFIGGMLAGDFAYRLTPDGRGGTHFVHEMRIKPVGGLVTVLWEVLGKHLHRHKMKTFLARIKEIVEADWQSLSARPAQTSPADRPAQTPRAIPASSR
ncbi:MAG: SRPBCC family protein [Myxococcales bacterium]|nr:SRPBCC family protein [Myxococcales bacterium]